MEIGNRYFTSKRLALTEQHMPFSPSIDPKGFLEEMRGDSFLHTSENQVEYYERYMVNNEQKFKSVLPAFIKCGDLVEVQLTISLVDLVQGKNAIHGNQYITKLILRSVTLLDQTFTEKWQLANVMPQKQLSLKRKVGHDDEQSREAQERLKRMAIDKQ
ncbi:hypothetical protein VNI00_017104 [Paramarasmius palmivorus]|uniref:Uncharacterized protein n=1 Tax=Paramarasmius palmivorus TaxID=297713 RepID=A0AAW0B749_9AGAR